MAREKFKTIVSQAVPVAVANIDTDQIIPARFLKATERKGFGDNLFRDWRYDKQGNRVTEFPLNDTKYSGSILVALENFGSGSSREHAAWAIYDYGFRVVVSSFFADIFKNNALNNGLLPIQVSEGFLGQVLSTIQQNPHAQFTIDLEQQKIIDNTTEEFENFVIDGYKKECLLQGYDDVDYLVSLHPEIDLFEQHSR